MGEPLTKRAILERGIDALDPERLAIAAVRHQATAGTVSEVNLPQVVEVAKFMSSSGVGVPEHCRGNVGVCLRITFQAVEWGMSPFSVADQSYIINGRVAYMSRLLHAVVEGRAPLRGRLDCRYEGEGPERTCTVIGVFVTGDRREYKTPAFKDIRVKNSPLWKDDPDQQQFYYATRSWARKWCPDVLLGVYTKEELIERPILGREEDDTAPGLHARLSGSEKSDEGHTHGHAARELAQIVGGGQTIEHEPTPQPAPTEKAETKKTKVQAVKQPSISKARAAAVKAAADRAEAKAEAKAAKAEAKAPAEPRVRMPRTFEEWRAYTIAWIQIGTDVEAMKTRWNAERKLRNDIGITSEERKPIDEFLMDRFAELEN